jgi:hypothetical protein
MTERSYSMYILYSTVGDLQCQSWGTAGARKGFCGKERCDASHHLTATEAGAGSGSAYGVPGVTGVVGDHRATLSLPWRYTPTGPAPESLPFSSRNV